HDISGLHLVSLAKRQEEHRIRHEGRRHSQGRARAKGNRDAQARPSRGIREQLSAQPVGRYEATRRHRPHPGAEPPNPADGRAIRRARCAGSLGDAGNDDRGNRTREEDGDHRDPRHRGGHLPIRPDHLLHPTTRPYQSQHTARVQEWAALSTQGGTLRATGLQRHGASAVRHDARRDHRYDRL
ncbi:uncharacterized protein METZ01_LOCUS242461, partial [marine metagenome]